MQGATYSAQKDEWHARIDAVLGAYDDPEDGHAAEDDLLRDFVRAVRDDGLVHSGAIATLIDDRLLSRERTRWYS